MDILIGILVALASGALGAWFGYYLAKKQNNRVRTADVALELFSGEFSSKRTSFFSGIDKLDKNEIAIMAARDDERYGDLRQAAFDICNRYELICYLKNNGDLDEEIFKRYILSSIKTDYVKCDDILNAIENDYKSRGVDHPRPFFAEIAKVAPRPKKSMEKSG